MNKLLIATVVVFTMVLTGCSQRATPLATLTVTQSLSPTVLDFAPTGLYFKTAVVGETPAQKVQIKTIMGSLDWYATTSMSWLKLSPSSGTASTTPKTMSVLCDTSGLSPGDYNGVISIKAPGYDKPLSVELVVMTPEIVPPETGQPINPWPSKWPSTTISTNGTTFTLTSHPPNPMLNLDASVITLNAGSGISPGPQTRQLSTSYDDTAWVITTDTPWLVATPMNGVATPAFKLISISANVIGLAPGTYKGNIYVSAHVFNDPVVIPVQLIIR